MTRKRVGAVLLSAFVLILNLGYTVQSEAAALPGWAARAQFVSQASCFVYASDNSVRNSCAAAGVDFLLPISSAGSKTITISGITQFAGDIFSCSAFVANQSGGLVGGNSVNSAGGLFSVTTSSIPANGTLLLRCTMPGGSTIRSIIWNPF